MPVIWNSIFLATSAAALYGSADFFGGLATRRASVLPVMIFSQLAGLAALLLVLPLLPKATATVADFSWGTLGGCALAIGLALLYHGLATGKMSVVAPVTAVWRSSCRRWRASRQATGCRGADGAASRSRSPPSC